MHGLTFTRVVLMGGVALCTVGCSQTAQTDTQKKAASSESNRMLQEASQKREAYQARLKSMDVNQLAGQLATESDRGLEPFNSGAFREMVARGAPQAAALKDVLTKADHTSLLGLLALRKISPEQYAQLGDRFRVDVLADALRSSKTFNIWGIPNLYWEEAARAFIAEGAAARPALLALLSDKRPATVWGSEGVAEARKYGYRVCDYAWAMLRAMTEKEFTIPQSPEERDRLIEEMQRSAAKKKK